MKDSFHSSWDGAPPSLSWSRADQFLEKTPMEVGDLEIDSLTGVMLNPLRNVGFTPDTYPSSKNSNLEQ